MTEDLQTSTRSLGPEHPHTLICNQNLGGLHTHMGNYEAAQAQLDQVAERQSQHNLHNGANGRSDLALSGARGLLCSAKGATNPHPILTSSSLTSPHPHLIRT